MRSRYKPMFWHSSSSNPGQTKRKSLDGTNQQGKQEAHDRVTRHRGLRDEEERKKSTGNFLEGKEYHRMTDAVGQPNIEARGHENLVSREYKNERRDMEEAEERLRGMQVSDPNIDP